MENYTGQGKTVHLIKTNINSLNFFFLVIIISNPSSLKNIRILKATTSRTIASILQFLALFYELFITNTTGSAHHGTGQMQLAASFAQQMAKSGFFTF